MTISRIRDDYRLTPLSGDTAQHVVVLLHGVGARGRDLFSLARRWQPLLPETEFICPNAPFFWDHDASCSRYQWFSLEGITLENREERVRGAVPLLDQFIGEVLETRGLNDSQLALVGFSQGAIMSLYTSLRRAHPAAAVLGYSGKLAENSLYNTELQAKPRTLLLHGSHDQTIPVQELYRSIKILKDWDVPVLGVALPGVGHEIPRRGETLGGQFLKYCLQHPGASMSGFLDHLSPRIRETFWNDSHILEP